MTDLPLLQRDKRHVFYTLVEEGLPSAPKQTFTHGST
jgi:hypothetical protein